MADPYRIKVLPGNYEFVVPTGKTILEAALASSLRLPHSCNAGSCEICMGRLLQGEITIPRRGLHLTGDAQNPPSFLTCIAQPMSDSIIEIPSVLGPGELPQFTATCQIIEATPLNHDVTRVVLRLPAGKRIQFLPGQYLEVMLNEADKVSFSIGNIDLNDRLIELHVRYVPTSESSNKFRDYLKTNKTIKVNLPKGQCIIHHANDENPVLFLAGSTGFSPIKAMIEYLLAANSDRTMYLYWGARIPADIYLPDLPREWEAKYPYFKYVPVISDPVAEQEWAGRRGFVHAAVLDDFPNLSAFDVYAGGSPGMVYAAFDAFTQQAKLDPERMYSDVFFYAPRKPAS